MIAGQIEEKPRHYLFGRMPAFPAYAEKLSTGLSHWHGFGEKAVNHRIMTINQCRDCDLIKFRPARDRTRFIDAAMQSAMVNDGLGQMFSARKRHARRSISACKKCIGQNRRHRTG